MWWLRGLRAAMCRLPGPRPYAPPGRVPAAAPRSAHASPAWSGTRAGLRPCLQPSRASRARASALLWGSQPSPHPSLPPGLQCCSHGFCPQPQTTGPPVSEESRGHWRAKGACRAPQPCPARHWRRWPGGGRGRRLGCGVRNLPIKPVSSGKDHGQAGGHVCAGWPAASHLSPRPPGPLGLLTGAGLALHTGELPGPPERTPVPGRGPHIRAVLAARGARACRPGATGPGGA